MRPDTDTLSDRVELGLLERNRLSAAFFPDEAGRLAEACREMADRFKKGGRLLAFGQGPYVTDAQHVSVEFVHPVIVGKRALPALDVSAFIGSGFQTLVRPDDIVMGFGPPGGDPQVEAILAEFHERGVLTLALPGRIGDYATVAPAQDPFIHQEIIEVLYHTLWETVHVFHEHSDMGHDVGESAFLYPFLGRSRQDTSGVVDDVAASIVAKAAEDERLRGEVARQSSAHLSRVARDIRGRIDDGGKILAFGNGGSATDANDFVFDCLMPPSGMAPVPAVSLSMEPAVLSAISNDVGEEAVYVRQVIAHGDPKDVAVAFSTSGSSRNIVAALMEARKCGLLTVAFTGYEGGEIAARKLADHVLIVPSDHIPRIQEIHASMYHVLRRTIDYARGSEYE